MVTCLDDVLDPARELLEGAPLRRTLLRPRMPTAVRDLLEGRLATRRAHGAIGEAAR
jgi:hypothetical protein